MDETQPRQSTCVTYHAKSSRTGKPCKNLVMKGSKVCRMHGAGGGASSGQRNGMWKHGERSRDVSAIDGLGPNYRAWPAK